MAAEAASTAQIALPTSSCPMVGPMETKSSSELGRIRKPLVVVVGGAWGVVEPVVPVVVPVAVTVPVAVSVPDGVIVLVPVMVVVAAGGTVAVGVSATVSVTSSPATR